MDDFIVPSEYDWAYMVFDLNKEPVEQPVYKAETFDAEDKLEVELTFPKGIYVQSYSVGECQCGEIEQAMYKHLISRRN